MQSLARNGFLEYRPVDPGLKTMRLVRTRGQAWRDALPKPEDSHRLQRSWVHRRWSYVNAEGVPTKPLEFEEEFLQEARSVARPEQVQVTKSEAGESLSKVLK